ncbi:MAG TPA: helix-turn-helix domain-containing protein [Trebonia sp.]
MGLTSNKRELAIPGSAASCSLATCRAGAWQPSDRKAPVGCAWRPAPAPHTLPWPGHRAGHGRVPLPQRTLAAMLGVQRPSLNKVLKDLEREGLIKISYSTIDILDAAGLARIAK